LKRRVCIGLAMALVAGVAAGAPEAQPGTEPTKVLTFIEVRSDAVAKGKAILARYDSVLKHRGPDLQVETLEEIGRPERFVVLESAPRAEDLPKAEAETQDNLAPLNELLTALPDRRTNREFAPAATATRTVAPKHGDPGDGISGGGTALYVVAHLDLGPPDQARGTTALQGLMAAARRAPGNLSFEAWQQTNRPNHFNLVAVWSSRTGFDDFAAGAAAREYRATIGPLIGSPYDERLYRAVSPSIN
jgi:quinol monooxygenase YgiN